MIIRTVRIPYKAGDVFTLIPLGDLHFGSAACDVSLLDSVIAEIRDNPKALWIGMGDMCEAIGPSDKRWDAGGLDKNVVRLDASGHIGDTYVRKCAARLRPIAAKCLAYGDGNHELTWYRHYHSNLSWRVLEGMGLGNEDPDEPPEPYTQWESLTRIIFQSRGRSVCCEVDHAHGYQSGRKDGAKVNSMDELPGWIEADIYLRGHSHSLFAKPVDVMRKNNRRTEFLQKRVYVGHTGSFLKTYAMGHSHYAERGGYRPVPLGVLRFELRPCDDGVRVRVIQ